MKNPGPKKLAQIGVGKAGVSCSWTLDGVEIMFTAPDVECLKWFFGVLDEKFDPAICSNTVMFPAEALLQRANQQIMEEIVPQGQA